eukprot:scaffold1605_cov340-Prasinococcus_capsulatus_cf.AAC.1
MSAARADEGGLGLRGRVGMDLRGSERRAKPGLKWRGPRRFRSHACGRGPCWSVISGVGFLRGAWRGAQAKLRAIIGWANPRRPNLRRPFAILDW